MNDTTSPTPSDPTGLPVPAPAVPAGDVQGLGQGQDAGQGSLTGSVAGQSMRSEAASTTDEIPFHEANLDDRAAVTLTSCAAYGCGDKRRVEVWKVKDGEGYCIRIYRPTQDGKISKLEFGLTTLAAGALMVALVHHLVEPEAKLKSDGTRENARNTSEAP